MMTAVVFVDAEVITIRGHQVRECLRRARMRPIYVHGRDTQGWVLDRRRLGDAVAALERGGFTVRLEGDPVQLSLPDDEDPDLHGREQLDLHGRDEGVLW